MQQAIRMLKQISCVGMIVLCPRQVWRSWVHAPWLSIVRCPFPKIARQKRAKSPITQRWIIWFRSNFVYSLNALQLKGCKSSRSRGQSSRSQGYITCAKIRKIINNSIARFRSNFVQTLITWRLMYHELSTSTGQRLKSQHDMTYQHKNANMLARISCRRSNVMSIWSLIFLTYLKNNNNHEFILT